jgi:hypothetical protein
MDELATAVVIGRKDTATECLKKQAKALDRMNIMIYLLNLHG